MKRSPPANWESLYNVVKTVRSHVRAPVDTIGCSRLFDPKATKEDQRYQTLLALMLSAQTRDQKTAEAMGNLKMYGCTARQIAKCDEKKLDTMIGMVGFHNNKANYIKRTTDIINSTYGGTVPFEYKQLTAMPGLGPKMVHLFLQCADGQVEGIGVDVHVHRIAHRWKWVSPKANANDPDETRKELEAWLPKKHWEEINELLVGFGQTICSPRFPDCLNCPARSLCPNAFKEESARQKTERLGAGLATHKKAKEAVAQVVEEATTPKKKKATKALDLLCKDLALKRKEKSEERQESAAVATSPPAGKTRRSRSTTPAPTPSGKKSTRASSSEKLPAKRKKQ